MPWFRLRATGPSTALAVAIVCLAMLGSFFYWSKLADLHSTEYVAALDRNEQRAKQLSEAATQQFDGTLRSADSALQYLRDVYLSDRGGFDQAVHLVLANYPEGMLDMVVITGPDGYVTYASKGPAKRLYLGDREHIQVHRSGSADRLFISRPLMGRIGDQAIVPVSRPIRKNGKFLGVISMPLRPQYFADKFSALQVEPDDVLSIVHEDGSFIARNHRLEEALKTRLPPSRPFLNAAPGMRGVFRDVSKVDHKPLVFAWRRLAQWPVSIVVAVNEAAELSRLTTRQARERERAGLAIGVVLLAALAIVVLVLRLSRKSIQLAENEGRFRNFFEKNGSVMLLIDPKSGRIEDANAAACRFYGYSENALCAMPISQINTLSPEEIRAEMEHATHEERNYFNFRHRLASGEVCEVEVYSTPVVVNARPVLFSIVHDMTARRRAEAERRLLAQAVEQSPVAIVVARPDGSIEYVNDALCLTSGYSPEEARALGAHTLMSDDSDPASFEALWERVGRGEPWKGTFQSVRKDGSRVWESAQIAPVLGDHGDITHYLAVKENISERKLAEGQLLELQARLQASHNMLERLSQNVPGVIYQFRRFPDGHSSFPYASQGIEEIYGVSAKEVLQDAAVVFERLHPDDLEAVAQSIRISAEALTPWHLDYRAIHPHHGQRWLSGVANPTRLEDGSVLWHGFIKDVTDRKLLEQSVLDRSRDMNTILDNSSVGISFVKNRFQIWANRRMAEMFGYRMEDMPNLSTRPFYPTQEAYDELGRAGYASLSRGERFVAEQQMLTRQGQTLWVRMSGKAVEAHHLEAGSIWIFEDITEQKKVETRLTLAASVFTHAREGIMITDAQGTIIDVNETFSQITGYTRDEALGHSPRILKSGRQPAEFYAAMWRSLIEKGHWYGEVWNRRKTGEVYAEMQTISAVRDAAGTTQQYVSLFSDITALKEHEAELEHIAHYDALTQLPNRVLLADRLRQGLIQSQRRKHSLAVVFLDLDGFKAVNDVHGHAAGDKLLIEIALRMKAALREGDTLSRIGGDEFVAILADLERVESCQPVLERMLLAASSPVDHGGQLLQVSASMGVTVFPQDGSDADLLMRQADLAMYSAKLAGKNRYHMFDVAQDRALRSRRESVERIQKGLQEQEFVLYYQPKVDLRTNVVVGVEALIRWQHPQHGLMLPGEFLPVIEDHACSVELGEWVITSALKQIKAWQAQALDLPVSINIGAQQLQDEHFAERLRSLLQTQPDVAANRLEIEVLETNALRDLIRVGGTMRTCHGLGVRFALDDFGTGYSSLTYLKHLPAHTLKIDQSFIRDMLTVESDMAIVAGVIGLARAFDRNVIAEGVETQAHAQLLRSLGCEVAQGFGIAVPMPAAALPHWLLAWHADPRWLA